MIHIPHSNQAQNRRGIQSMPKYKIHVHTDNCTGCLRCQLGCSDLYAGAFNPASAHIQVTVSGSDCSIGFTEKCTQCGVCADNCFYDALEKKPEDNST
jgi:ferredoxin